jgi:hypothetical protein
VNRIRKSERSQNHAPRPQTPAMVASMQSRDILTKATRTIDAGFTKYQAKFAADAHRDIMYENTMLLLQHSLLYLDFDDAISSGDMGRVIRNCELQLLLFHGRGGRSKYAREILRQHMEMHFVWTPYMRQLYMDNALLSLSGNIKGFMPVDRYMEHQVNQLKSVYHGAAQVEARNFWRYTIAPNVLHFRDIIRNVSKSTATSKSGFKHTFVKEECDIYILMNLFTANEVLELKPGRVGFGAAGSVTNQHPRSAKESTRYFEVQDLILDGISKLRNPDIISKCRAAVLDDFSTGQNDVLASWGLVDESSEDSESYDELVDMLEDENRAINGSGSSAGDSSE